MSPFTLRQVQAPLVVVQFEIFRGDVQRRDAIVSHRELTAQTTAGLEDR